MADTSGQALIRGLQIDKALKGFSDEAIIMKKYVTVTPTSAREVRWFQKTSGFITGVTTTGITASPIANVAPGALPSVAEQSFTRNTSYVRKYMVESPWLTEEDIRDSDVDVLGTNIRDLLRAVENQVDIRIWNVMTESQSAVNINSVTTTSIGGDQWDAASDAGDPVKDVMRAKKLIRDNGYDPEGAVLFLNPLNHESLLVWLYHKGAQAPSIGGQIIGGSQVMGFLGLQVVVSTAVTADYAAVVVPGRAGTWKSFGNLASAVKVEEGIGRKIRFWE